MAYIFSLLPVLFFLASLYFFDSFKLVAKSKLIICIFWGILAAIISFYINEAVFTNFHLSFDHFTKYVTPLTEEIAKSLIVILLLIRKQVGFTIDAAIYGFASGAGFALTENIFYLIQLENPSGLIVWILRGFGTAIMHGGTTAIFAMLLMGGIQRHKKVFLSLWPGLLAAYLLHSLFNHFLLNPYLQTIFLLIIWPVVFMVVFRRSTLMLQNWLEIEFSSEVDMLRMIRVGKFRQTKAGSYLDSLKKYFDPETIVDLYCYVSLYLELSIKAKRNMMLRENGFKALPEAGLEEKLKELKQLRKQVGKTGEMALQPLVRMNHREIWKLNLLKH